MERTVCQQLPHNIMLEVIHVHYTGDVPKAVTVNGIFSRDVYGGMHTGVRKAVAVMDCTTVSINRSCVESFSPCCTKVFHVWPWKKAELLYFGNERTAPISNPSLGKETGVWFHRVCSLPRFTSTHGTFSILIFNFWVFHSENINWGKVYSDG